MGNPADRYGRTNKTFVNPISGSEQNQIDELMKAIRRETYVKAIVLEQPENPASTSSTRFNYLVDIYGNGYGFQPTMRSIKAYRLLSHETSAAYLDKYSPVYVKMYGDGCIICDEELPYYLWMADPWPAGGPNRFQGHPTDINTNTAPPSGFTPHAEILQVSRKININIVYPYYYEPVDQFLTTGVRFFGAGSQIVAGSVIPFRRYEMPIINTPFQGNAPLGIPADGTTFRTIGVSQIMNTLPYGSGKYRVLQIIDDLNPGTLGFDFPKFPANSSVP